MLTIGCPQQVCPSGNSTSTPSRRSRVTTALPVSGKSASLRQVTWRATRTRSAQPLLGGVPVTRDVVRLVALQSLRTTHQRAHRRQVRQLHARAPAPAPARCPARPPRSGPATTGRPQASAVSWQSSPFCEPPPTTCTTSGRTPAMRRRRPHGAPVGQRQAVQHQPDHAHPECRHRLSRLLGQRAQPSRHVARREQARVVDVDHAAEVRLRHAAQAEQVAGRVAVLATRARTPRAPRAPSRSSGTGRCRRRRPRW